MSKFDESNREEWFAGLLAAGALQLSAGVGECPPLDVLTSYAFGNVADAERRALDLHCLGCSRCRTTVAKLRLTEVAAESGFHWRLRYLREFKSLAASPIRDRIARAAALLRSTQAGSTTAPSGLTFPIDAQGRLFYDAIVITAEPKFATFSLVHNGSKLELFSTTVSHGRVTALVDLACLEQTSFEVDGAKVLITAESGFEHLASSPDVLVQEEQRPAKQLDLKLADSLIAGERSAHRTGSGQAAVSLAADVNVLAMFLNAWAAGNFDEMPDSVYERYAELAIELAEDDIWRVSLETSYSGPSGIDMRAQRSIVESDAKEV